jgi:soluble lytic murein transglycosylase-like protein
MSSCPRFRWNRRAAPLALAAALAVAAAPLHAGTIADAAAAPDDARDAIGAPSPGDGAPFPSRAAVRALIEKENVEENGKSGLPADIAEAVIFVESRYDPDVIGRAGEIGLMQVRPETASMLGFRGTAAELAKPDVNIHYGVTYLAQAWRLAQGDLCRALMKYRAGHGEDTMTARSAIYCNRARNRLIAMNSPFATPGAVAAVAPNPAAPSTPGTTKPSQPKSPIRPTDVYATYKHGTAAASRAFWAAHEARIRAVKARIEAKWRRVASK